MSGVQERRIDQDEEGLRLDRWFKKHYPALTFSRLAKLLRTGQIRLDGKRAKAGDRVTAGATVRVPPLGDAPPLSDKRPRAEPTAAERAALTAMILYQDDSVIVLNKPPGLAVQGGSKTTKHIDGMLDALVKDGQRPRLVHRLDKDTSGVLILARTGAAATALGQSFYGRTAKKVYWALVVGRPELDDGKITAPLAKEPGRLGERMEVSEEGKKAVTRFHVMDSAGSRTSWLALMPLTGRTHQLRAHCAYMGTPIVGDGKYGGAEAYLTGVVSRKLHLHARRLIVPHPKGGTIDVTAPLPAHMAETWATFGFAADDQSDPFANEE